MKLHLQQGKNEILIGLTNYFYGCASVARLDDLDGILFPNEIETNGAYTSITPTAAIGIYELLC